MSENAQNYLGTHTPSNTVKASKSGFRLFAEFVVSVIFDKKNAIQYSSLVRAASAVSENVPGTSEYERKVIRVLLNGRPFSEGLDKESKYRLNHFLIEFATSYVSKRSGVSVSPSSMLSYIRSIQRRLSELAFPVNLFSEKIFADKSTGIVSVLNNRFSEQQARGAMAKPHNILSMKDILSIFNSEH